MVEPWAKGIHLEKRSVFYVRDKQNKGRWIRYLFLPLLVMFGVISFMSHTITVEAGSALTAPKTKIISKNPNQTMDTKYGFVPELHSGAGQTVLITPNNGWFDTTYNLSPQSTVFQTKSLDIGSSTSTLNTRRAQIQNGQHWWKYTNVGYINGRSVDLKITIKNFRNHLVPNNNGTRMALGYLSFPKNQIGFISQGVHYTDLEWTILDSATGNVVTNVSGYYTFNDIDFEQYVGFPTSTWNNQIDQVYITNESNRLSYHGPNTNFGGGSGVHAFAYDNKVNRVDTKDTVYDHRHAITVLYSNADSLNIRWGMSVDTRRVFYPPYAIQRHQYYRVGNTIGDLLMYTTIKPVATKPGRPSKSVTHNGPYGPERVIHGTTVTYTVEQQIPFEHPNFYYDTFELRDQMDSVYDIDSVRVFNTNGADVSGRFNITTTNNRVRAIAKSSELNKASFYNQKYRLEIKAKVVGSRVVSKFGGSSSYKISNTAVSIIDGTTYTTNRKDLMAYRKQVVTNHKLDRGGTIAPQEVTYYIEGMTYNTAPKTNIRNSRNHLYRNIRREIDPATGVVGNRNYTVDYIYDEPREVIIEHRTQPRVSTDEGYDANGKLLGKDVVWEYDGKIVTGYGKKNHFKDHEGYFYRPRSNKESIEVNGDGMIIYIRYDIPRTITIHHDDKDPTDQIQSPNVKRLRTTYVKQIYDDQLFSIEPLVNTLTDSDGYYFRPVDPADRTGKILGDHMLTIEYERPRIIRLAHYDKDYGKNSNGHLRTDTHSARAYDKNANYYNDSGIDTASRYTVYSYKDEELTYHHIPNDKSYFYYVPTADRYAGDTHRRARQVGSVRDDESRLNIKNNTYTLDFFYTKPAVDVGLTYIRVDTDRVMNGLPINLEFDIHKIVDNRWADETVTLTVYDRDANDKVLYTTQVDVKAITDKKNNTVERVVGKLEIPADSLKSSIIHMDKGVGHIFDVVLTTNDKEKLVTGIATTANIDTIAYTASEQVINGISAQGESQTFEYKGVAMTERFLGEEIEKYYESSFVTIDPSINLLSGYGYESQQHVEFETEVPDHKYHRMNDLANIKGYASVHANIADGDYTFHEGRYEFNLEYPAGYQNGSRSRKVDFVMPEVHVNRKDGVITTTPNTNTVSGGRKVYVPIWTNSLGTFDYNFTTNRLGRNYVMYDLDQDVTVDAYMFGHIDSDTLSDDALMIEPAKTGLLDKWFGK